MRSLSRALALCGTWTLAAGCADVIGLNKLEKVDAVAPPMSICASASPQHLFCADFDESKDVSTGWNKSKVSKGATLALDTTISKTPPASASSIVPSSAGGDATASLETLVSLPKTTGLLVLAFDLNVTAADAHPAAPVEIASLTFGTMNTVVLSWASTGPTVSINVPGGEGGVFSQSYPLKPAPTPGTWSHVEIDVGLAQGQMGSLVVSVDSATAAQAEAIPTETTPTESVTLTLGVVAGTKPATFGAHFDNVTVDLD